MKHLSFYTSKQASRLQWLMIVLLTLRIISYFVLTDSVAIVQLTKASLRLSITGVLVVMFLLKSNDTSARVGKSFQVAPWILYMLYLVLGAASLCWSSSFHASFLQWLMDVEGFVFVWMFMGVFHKMKRRDQFGLFELNKILAPAVLIVSVGFVLGNLVDPDRFNRLTHGGQVSRLGGYIINPNELGMLLVIGISCFLPLLLRDKKLRVSVALAIALMTYQLILTGSRSSLIGLLLVLLLYTVWYGSRVSKLLIVASTTALIPLAGWSFFVKQGQISELFTLTGRIPFWKDLLTYNFPREPWLGFGYMRIDYADKFDSLNAYAGAMTHNTFLQVLLGLGMGGLLLVLTQLSVFIYFLSKVKDKALQRSFVLILIPLLINSFTEFGIFGETNYGIIFYLFLVFSVTVEPISFSRRIIIHRDEKQVNFNHRPEPIT